MFLVEPRPEAHSVLTFRAPNHPELEKGSSEHDWPSNCGRLQQNFRQISVSDGDKSFDAKHSDTETS
jgi:hypothetical protein